MLYIKAKARGAIQYLCLLITAALLSVSPIAGATITIPTQQQPYGSDRITTSDGTSCESAVSSGTTFSAGIAQSQSENGFNNPYQSDDKVVYAQINVPIDFSGRKRLNCNRLYELELDRIKQELMRLQLENKLLKQGGISWNKE